MNTTESILVIESGEEKLFQEILGAKPNYGVKKVDFREARTELRKGGTRLVIFNLEHSRDEAKALAQEAAGTLAESYTAVSAGEISFEDMVDFMRLGVKDFLRQPLHRPELHNLLSRIENWNPAASIKEKAPVSAAFFSTKGGVGVTLASVNVAAALARRKAGRTVVADFDLQHGNVSEFLDMIPQYTLFDLLENRERLDARLLDHSLQKHGSGCFVLPHPKQPEESECFVEGEVAAMMQILKRSFDCVLVDAGHEFNACSVACLDACDVIFLMTTPDLPSLFNARRALEMFKKMGYADEKVRLVLNRWKMKGQIDGSLITKHITHPVLVKIAEDTGLALSAANQGQPVYNLSPGSELSKGFEELADFLVHFTAKSVEKKGK